MAPSSKVVPLSSVQLCQMEIKKFEIFENYNTSKNVNADPFGIDLIQ